MTMLRELRTNMQAFYGRYSSLLHIIFKIMLSLGMFLFLRHEIPAGGLFGNIFVILVMALLSAVLPVQAIPVFGAFMLGGLSYSLGLAPFGITVLVLLILLFLFLRFSSAESTLILLFTPVTLFFGVPAVVPVCAALKQKMSSVLSVGSGVIVYYLIRTLQEFHITVITSSTDTSRDILTNLQALANGIFGQADMILNLIILCAVFILVHAFRSLPVRGAYPTAVVAGVGFYGFMMVFGSSTAGFDLSYVVLAAGCFAALVTAAIFIFFIHDVDYKAAENLQFEDDDYVYYVKAVPKIAVRTAYADAAAAEAEADDDDEDEEET